MGAAPIKSVLNFEAALPFLYADFGPRERAGLARAIDAWTAPKGLYSTAPDCPAFSPENAFRGYQYPCCWNGPVWNYATSWVLHALGAVASRTREEPLRARFARAWTQWTASHLTLGEPMVVEHFHPETGRPYRLIPDYFHSAWLDTFFRHVVDGAARRHRAAAASRACPWKERRSVSSAACLARLDEERKPKK